MTVTATYDSTLSRVQVTATSITSALTATFERSTNGVTWTTVRGGSEVTVTSNTATVDDYEFVPGIQNTYRVTYRSTFSYVGAGTADTDNNASVTPTVPAGTTSGDVLLIFAGIRNFGSGTVNVPSGWSTILDMGGNVKLLGKIAGSSESTPTVTFSGGVAGADTAARMIALRGVDFGTAVSKGDTEAATGTDITTPILELAEEWRGGEVIYMGWKSDDWASAAMGTGTEIGEMISTLGSDMAMVWNHREIAESVVFDEIGAQTFTITGGTTASQMGGVAAFQAKTLTQTGTITPNLTDVWLKFIARPFLNTAVDAFGEVNITRPARNAVFPVVGRSAPVGVTDVRAGRQFDLAIKTLDAETHSRLDFALAGGDPVFIHAPADSPVPSMYAVVGDVTDAQPVPGTHFWTLPMQEVAAPADSIVGATITYQGVLNAYGTYQDVIDGEASYSSILTLIGDPSDVIIS